MRIDVKENEPQSGGSGATDNRLLRRIIRDYKYRGISARESIRRWPSVRRGEERWIFPYQENADATFNSALLFEIGVIREEAERILREVHSDIRGPICLGICSRV